MFHDTSLLKRTSFGHSILAIVSGILPSSVPTPTVDDADDDGWQQRMFTPSKTKQKLLVKRRTQPLVECQGLLEAITRITWKEHVTLGFLRFRT